MPLRPAPLHVALVASLALAGGVACTDHTPTAPATPGNAGVRFALAASGTQQHSTYEVPIEATFSCGSFDVRVVGSAEVNEVLFLDATGAPSSVNLHIKRRVTLTNLSTGQSVVDRSDGNQRIDFTAGLLRASGKYVIIQGDTRFRDVGRMVVDLTTGEVLFQAGPKDTGAPQTPLGGGDLRPPFCAELAA